MSLNSTQYELKTLSNHSTSIPIVTPQIKHTNNVSTPEWMILMDTYLSSTVKKFELYTELYGWHAEHARLTKGRVAGQLFSTAAAQHSDVLVVLPAGIYIPTLETKMNSGTNIKGIVIVRIGNIGNQNLKLQTIAYTNCKIEWIQQQLDELIISFRPTNRLSTIYKYNQAGRHQGQSVSFFDYTTGSGVGVAV